ncbi:SH3-domain-containing protein [Mytilinidion resinicola]|uniref:SH3-domain-containing protein n=1 Tax=Mytilinidion resinicola TaxID=574789 RepID=A0A6A6YVJ9_9PEZI|nr:SH3-domain-containing protein [Mytilinidion resinicola]KAF2812578.1 SH3-domain-containing protein [Mytilinidion resinicola]
MADAFNSAMAKRSLRTIQTELEFLVDSNVITNEQFTTIVNQLPLENTRTQSAATPVNAMAALAIQQPPQQQQTQHEPHHQDEKKQKIGYYADNNPPPPAYPSAPPAPAILTTATALYQYNAQDAGDLALMPNDSIAVTEYMNAEWWKGKNERTGHEGIFPSSYVKAVESKGAAYNAVQPYQQTQPSNYGNMPLDVSQGAGGQPGTPGKGQEMGKKFGKKLGNAAVFGAGATIGSKIVDSIF